MDSIVVLGPLLLLLLAPFSAALLPETSRSGGNLTVFTGSDGLHGREPWVTDGTEAGTFQVADIGPGIDGSSPEDLTAFGSSVVFSANDGAVGREAWTEDTWQEPFAMSLEALFFADGFGSGNTEQWKQLVAVGPKTRGRETANPRPCPESKLRATRWGPTGPESSLAPFRAKERSPEVHFRAFSGGRAQFRAGPTSTPTDSAASR